MKRLFPAFLTLALCGFLLAETTATRLLVVGDSISKHSPSEKLGWTGHWGMAASSEDRDFAHLLAARLQEVEGKPVTVSVYAEGGGTLAGKLQGAEKLSAMKADLIVIQMGENDNAPVTGPQFQKSYGELIALLRTANPGARMVCTGVWGRSAEKDGWVKAVCRQYKIPFADISEIQKNDLAWAKSTGKWAHTGVGWHPSDLGMAGYADAILKALKDGNKAIPAGEDAPPAPTVPAVLLDQGFAKAEDLKSWAGSTTLGNVTGGTCLVLISTNSAGAVMVSRPLVAADVAGRTIRVTARVKGVSVEKPPKPYHGVKLMLSTLDAEGAKDYPQAPAPSGTFEWTDISFEKKMPQNLVTVTLNLGLERVSGKLYVDRVKVQVISEGKGNGTGSIHPVTSPASAPYPARLELEPRKILGPVNALLFGHNLEAADGMGIFGSTKQSPKPDGDGFWDIANRRPDPKVLELSKGIGVKAMRYPGGCLVHNFDWHKAVGPAADRPDFAFGVDEWVDWCRAAGAEPLFTVPVYVGTPADKADLVEYCNAPATADHPWAMKRAAWGHKEPFGIRFWEIGNEEDHGNHDVKPKQKFTAAQYADYFLACRTAMKKVDPSIRMSVHMGTGTPPSDPWNAVVMAHVKDRADFVAVHTYLPPGASRWMGATEYALSLLHQYRGIIRSNAGVDLPLAVTEYNVGNQPERFSWAGALFCGDYLRAMMDPGENILMANYWQMLGGFWGFLRKEGGDWKKLGGTQVYDLWNNHRGDRRIAAKMESPMFQVTVGDPVPRLDYRVAAAKGDGWEAIPGTDGGFHVRVNGLVKEAYPNLASLPASHSSVYRLRFEGRFTGEGGASVLGLGLMDQRGWGATQSAVAIEGLQSSPDWSTFEVTYSTLPDAKGVTLVGRLRGNGSGAASGLMEIRNMTVEREPIPGYPVCTSAATISADGKTVHLILFNKSLTSPVNLDIALPGIGSTGAKWWTSRAETITGGTKPDEIAKRTRDGVFVPVEQGLLRLTLEPVSMHGVDIPLP